MSQQLIDNVTVGIVFVPMILMPVAVGFLAYFIGRSLP